MIQPGMILDAPLANAIDAFHGQTPLGEHVSQTSTASPAEPWVSFRTSQERLRTVSTAFA